MATRALNEDKATRAKTGTTLLKEEKEMAEQNNQNTGVTPGNDSSQEVRTFTQEEVNAAVESRLAKERRKYADYDALKEKAGKYDEQQEAGKTELQKANERADALQKQLDALNNANTISQVRAKVSKDTGVPAELLTGEDEESCKTQADAILKFAKPNSYPGTKKNERNNNNAGSGHNKDEAMREFARSIFSKGE